MVKFEITENVYTSNTQMKREDSISKGRSSRERWLRGQVVESDYFDSNL